MVNLQVYVPGDLEGDLQGNLQWQGTIDTIAKSVNSLPLLCISQTIFHFDTIIKQYEITNYKPIYKPITTRDYLKNVMYIAVVPATIF